MEDVAVAERRRHRRFSVACPITIVNRVGGVFFTKTIDVSDGGLLVAYPFGEAPRVGEILDLELRLPGAKGGASLIFTTQGEVVRHQQLDEQEKIAIGVQFLAPLKLGLSNAD